MQICPRPSDVSRIAVSSIAGWNLTMIQLLKRTWIVYRLPTLDEVFREITRRSTMGVRAMLSAKTSTMSDAELRGYVRARGARTVRQEAERLATEQGWRIALSAGLVSTALERTVYQVVYQMGQQ